MKVLYFGTICDLNAFEETLKLCKSKPTIATVLFESALLKGFYQNDLHIDIYSTPMIPNYNKSKQLYWGRKREHLRCGYMCTWLKTINVIFLKQITRRLDGRAALKKWLIDNQGEDKIVLTYGISPYLSKDIVTLCQKHHATSCAIVPDLPRFMYLNVSNNKIQSRLKQWYLKPTLKTQKEFDCYVYLTEAMAQEITDKKPYIVMEGILNPNLIYTERIRGKSSSRSIMYAGRLNEKYGIINLIDAFEAADIPNTELWLFGDGNAVETIRTRASKNPRICYFGNVTHDKILEFEKIATILVNPRSSQETFTKYSFPSKTIEYMVSGTPLLTTKLDGIPDEYFNYVFSVTDNNVTQLQQALQEILSKTDDELVAKGTAAQQFILTHKNSQIQGRKIIEFLNKIIEGKS